MLKRIQSVSQVGKAIHSFPCTSAAGTDGLHPQHLKNMIRAVVGEGQALTRFANLVLEGKVTSPARHFFLAATLIALGKKDSGLRPIAVGCTLRQLVAKCACNSVKQSMAAQPAPNHLGFGIPLGVEAAVHGTRVYLQDLSDCHLLLKMDYRNAFNSLRWNKMLLAVCERVPQLFSLFSNLLVHPGQVLSNLQTVTEEAAGLGVQLNHSKSDCWQ